MRCAVIGEPTGIKGLGRAGTALRGQGMEILDPSKLQGREEQEGGAGGWGKMLAVCPERGLGSSLPTSARQPAAGNHALDMKREIHVQKNFKWCIM